MSRFGMVVSIWLFFVIGWVLNTAKGIIGFIHADTVAQVSTTVWVQIGCIFTGPVGSIVGWFVW